MELQIQVIKDRLHQETQAIPKAKLRYTRGRLTLDKVNAAINDMAFYADTNAHPVTAPKKKLGVNTSEKALVLRHLGRVIETRVGHKHVIILSKPQ